MVNEIRQLLGETAVVGSEILHFAELDSTNTYTKTRAMQGAIPI